MRKPRLWYALANIGPYALVPLVCTGLLLPAGLLFAQASGGPQVSRIFLDFSVTLLAPALAAWWAPFVFKERIEGDGREVLYFLKRSGEGATALALALSYWALLIPLMLVANGTPGHSSATMALLLARCLFMTSLAFCAAYVLRSSALGLMLALVFNMLAMTPLEGLAASLAPSAVLGAGQLPVFPILLYAMGSTLLLGLGEATSRRFTG